MGTSTSTYQGALDLDLTEEISKPIHGSDINTPRGVTARKEVMRLRALLREVYANTAPILISDNPSNAMRVGAPAAATKVQDLKKKNTQRPQGEEPQEELLLPVKESPPSLPYISSRQGSLRLDETGRRYKLTSLGESSEFMMATSTQNRRFS